MKILITLLLMLGSCLLALGQKASDAQSLVDAERAFARTSVEKGTRPAFMEFIADDGILFRPGAVKGKQWMIDHPAPAPAPNKRPVLNWGPTFALVSRAGDLGYDFGPWEAKGDINDEKPGAFGHFITVWKRQADGNWKFVVDLGISHPGPHPGPPEWKPDSTALPEITPSNLTLDRERFLLIEHDRTASDAMRAPSSPELYFGFGGFPSDIRLFREGETPIVGKEAALRAIPKEQGSWSWVPIGGDVSSSRDLGYTYGTYVLKTAKMKKEEKGNYLRVWQKRGSEWLIVVDVASPLQPG